MPLIRKKTSKRITTHKRQRIKHKVAEGKRKKRKESKKNPQWKSKKKKDPGIPSNLPFRDDIIAEITEERRQKEENKKRKKEEKLFSKESEDVYQDTAVEKPNIATSSKSKSQDEAPLLLNPDFPNLRAVIDKSHVVLNVLDARDPLPFIISHIKELVFDRKGARFAFILNKIDLIPKESATAWLKHLRSTYPTFAFRSASAFLFKPSVTLKTNTTAKGKTKESEHDAWGSKPLLDYFSQCVAELNVESLRVAVVGITNVGKSSIINSLACKHAVSVYECTASTQARGTTTNRAYEIEISAQDPRASYVLIDTPGISFQPGQQYTQDTKAQDLLMRRRGRVDKVKDPLPLIDWIVIKAGTQDLMLHYNLPAFSKGDTRAFVSGIARTLNLVRKGGELDLNTAARSVLRDWNTGKLPIYTEPPTPTLESSNVSSDKDENILVKLRPWKEMWKEGLVKLERGEAEQRLVALNLEFEVEEMESDADLHDSNSVIGMGHDEEEEVEDNEDGDDDEKDADNRPIPHKRKATESKNPQPSKKVAFAAGVMDFVEKKAARKLQQLEKENQKVKVNTSVQLKDPPHGNKNMTKTMKNNRKPKVSKLNKEGQVEAPSSSKNSDPNVYDFDQFFKM